MSEPTQKQPQQTPTISMRGPGGPRGPRNMQPVEKPKDAKKALSRLFRYFEKEKLMVTALILIVTFMVICSVTAPNLQSNAINLIK